MKKLKKISVLFLWTSWTLCLAEWKGKQINAYKYKWNHRRLVDEDYITESQHSLKCMNDTKDEVHVHVFGFLFYVISSIHMYVLFRRLSAEAPLMYTTTHGGHVSLSG